jgi:hypothetical protein
MLSETRTLCLWGLTLPCPTQPALPAFLDMVYYSHFSIPRCSQSVCWLVPCPLWIQPCAVERQVKQKGSWQPVDCSLWPAACGGIATLGSTEARLAASAVMLSSPYLQLPQHLRCCSQPALPVHCVTAETNSLYWPWYCEQTSAGAKFLKQILQGGMPLCLSVAGWCLCGGGDMVWWWP